MSGVSAEMLGRRIADLADSKKAEDVVMLDMRDLVSYTDFLVICAARNERQARAIVDEVRVQIKAETSLVPSGSDRMGEADWVLLDYLDLPVLLKAGGTCTTEARERFQLEDLWREAPRLELSLDSPEAPSAASA